MYSVFQGIGILHFHLRIAIPTFINKSITKISLSKIKNRVFSPFHYHVFSSLSPSRILKSRVMVPSPTRRPEIGGGSGGEAPPHRPEIGRSGDGSTRRPESEQSTMGDSTKGTKRKWKLVEDRALVACMIELYHAGTHNAPSGFINGYLQPLEKLLKDKLPGTDLRAKPHMESRIKTLRNDWSIVYDMVYGSCTSGFGWDSERKVVVADSEVWDAYLLSHHKATPFRTKTLWYFEEFSMIYGKDRATGKDAQGIEDVLEEIQGEGNKEEQQSESTHEFDGSAIRTDGGSSRVDDVSSKKRKLKSTSIESSTAESILNAAKLLGDDMKEIGKELGRSIGVELTIQQKAGELFGVLNEIAGLNEKQKFSALRKIPDYPTQMLVFFSLPTEFRLEWVKDFLENTT